MRPTHQKPKKGTSINFLGGLGNVLLSRYTIIAINLFSVYLVYAFVKFNFHTYLESTDLHKILETLEGFGVIFIGWGVTLEERGTLKQMFGVDDEGSFGEDCDWLCHQYGLGLLVIGLFAEILIQFIKLPNEIINTIDIDRYLVGIVFLMMAFCAASMILLSYRLLKLNRNA